MQFWLFVFCPFHYTVCPLDAQHLTAALVAVEDLDMRLKQSSTEAVEVLVFIPTLRQLRLDVVSDHMNPLSIFSCPPVAGVMSLSGHSPLGAVGHVVSAFSSQRSFNDLQTSHCPKSASSLSKLELILPPKGDACLARWILNCPQVEELRVKCDSKGEEECIHTDQVSHS